MKKLSWINILALLIPLVCLTATVLLVMVQVRRINDLKTQRTQLERNIALVENRLSQMSAAPPPARIATVEMSVTEQLDFLNTLRAYADATKVRLVRWSAAPPIVPASAGQPEPGRRTLPPGVTPLASTVEVSGEYRNLREFMYSLLRSPRLYSMSDIRWVRGDRWPATSVTFILTRYVAAPASGAGATSGTTPGTGGVSPYMPDRGRPIAPSQGPLRSGPQEKTPHSL
jgi:hypothetical protein